MLDLSRLSRAELEALPTEQLDRVAFGFASGDVLDVPINAIHIRYAGDLEQAQTDLRRGGGWDVARARQYSGAPPVEAALRDGRLELEDGHHRYVAARILGRPILRARVTIHDNPINVILSLNRGERGWDPRWASQARRRQRPTRLGVREQPPTLRIERSGWLPGFALFHGSDRRVKRLVGSAFFTDDFEADVDFVRDYYGAGYVSTFVVDHAPTRMIRLDTQAQLDALLDRLGRERTPWPEFFRGGRENMEVAEQIGDLADGWEARQVYDGASEILLVQPERWLRYERSDRVAGRVELSEQQRVKLSEPALAEQPATSLFVVQYRCRQRAVRRSRSGGTAIGGGVVPHEQFFEAASADEAIERAKRFAVGCTSFRVVAYHPRVGGTFGRRVNL
jgi:hypothetical protein